MIKNAYEARELAKSSDDPKLEQTLLIIEMWASAGKYSGVLADPISEKLRNNLRARGFSVNGDSSITW